jgi:hypothetical protein
LGATGKIGRKIILVSLQEFMGSNATSRMGRLRYSQKTQK